MLISTLIYFLFSTFFDFLSVKSLEKSIFNSTNQNYLSSFLIQRWIDAREELGLNNSMFTSLNDDYNNFVNKINSVYTGVLSHSGVIVSHNKNGLVPYARIYKCGNEAIGYNLDHLSKVKVERHNSTDGRKWKIRRSENLVTQEELDSYLINFMSLEKLNKLPLFTFVRNPIEHFLSGYTELIYRSFYYNTNNYNNNKNRNDIKDNTKPYQMTVNDTKK